MAADEAGLWHKINVNEQLSGYEIERGRDVSDIETSSL
jgi:hypothetical protein